MKTILIISGVALAIILVWGSQFTRFGVESPEYQVLKKNGAFEIRSYPSMVIASTSMANPGEDNGFMRLFRYISGSNETGQKIAMTTPVLMAENGDDRQMSFVIPKEVADNGAPQARGEAVEIETMAAGKFATYRFAGNRDAELFSDAKRKLYQWISENNFIPLDDPIVASYDPPLTPSFLKRNEILIRIQHQ